MGRFGKILPTAMVVFVCYTLFHLPLSFLAVDSGVRPSILLHLSSEASYISDEKATGCFDLLIPFHISDSSIFVENGGLASIQRHVKGWRKTFIISADNSSLADVLDDRTIWIPQQRFSNLLQLNGWYFQQALKLLAPLQMPEIWDTFLVLDADLHFVRDYDFRRTPRKWDYLFPRSMPGGHPHELAGYAERSTKDFVGAESLMHGRTLCTVHHHMIMQKDVIAAMDAHVRTLHNRTLLDKIVQAQASRTWMSEFDIYLSFAWNSVFRERIHFVDFPYIHARDSTQCADRDANILKAESSIIFMACHDHYRGNDICVGSEFDCSSRAALCDMQSDGRCQLSDGIECYV